MAIMAAQKAAETSPVAVGARLLPGQDGETWVAIMAAQKLAEASSTEMEVGAPTKICRRGETSVAAQKAA